MKKQILVFLSLGLALGVFLGRGEVRGQGQEHSLQGKWSIFSITDEGKAHPVPKGSTATFTKDKLTLHEGKTTLEYGYHVDPSKSPHWIDLSVKGAKKQVLGIYEVKGETLYLSLHSHGATRSTHFESKAKTENDVLMVFKRAK